MTNHKNAAPQRATVLVEKLADQRLVEGMFRQELKAGAVRVEPCFTASGITSAAQRILLEGRGEFVVLVLNAASEETTALEEEVRGPIQRMLAHISPEGWHLAIASPRLDAWAAADLHIAQAFANAENAYGRQGYKEWSLLFEELTTAAPFDRKAAAAKFPEFKALAKCIEALAAHQRKDRAVAAVKTRQTPSTAAPPRAG